MTSTTYSTADNHPLTIDGLRKTMMDFRARYGLPLKAIKISQGTVYWIEQNFPIYPSQDMANTLYGVPIQIDNDLELFECQPVYV